MVCSCLLAAIDAVIDVMDRRIGRFKGKVYRSEQTRRADNADPARGSERRVEGPKQVEVGEDQTPVFVRTERFPMKPMALEDAITEMELLSHSFFFFYNIDTEEYNVVYRRDEGDYSVIEPELA